MAKILFTGVDLTHASVTNTIDVLETLGHTITQQTDAALVIGDMVGQDLLWCGRGSDSLAVATVKASIINAGYNVIETVLGGLNVGLFSANYGGCQAGLLGDVTVTSATVTNFHPVGHAEFFDNAGIGSNVTEVIFQTGTFGYTAAPTDSMSNHGWLKGGNAGQAGLTIMRKGYQYGTDKTMAGTYIFAGLFYNLKLLNDAGNLLLNAVLQAITEQSVTISGSVAVSPGDAKNKEIFCYSGSTGLLVSRTTANVVDGSYSVDVPHATSYFVVCRSGNEENDQVFGGIQP